MQEAWETALLLFSLQTSFSLFLSSGLALRWLAWPACHTSYLEGGRTVGIAQEEHASIFLPRPNAHSYLEESPSELCPTMFS